MKQIFFLLFLIALSCKKQRVCECTPSQINAAGVPTEYPLISTEIDEINRREMKSLCQSSSTVETIGSSVTTEKMDCKIK